MRLLCACLPVALLVLAGCSAENPSTSSESAATTPTGTKLPDPAPGAGIEMKPLKYAEFEEIVAKHKGDIVVVDFWFDNCIPCKKGMPHLVELQKKHAKDGLTIMTVNMDDPKNQERGLAFLRSAQITLPNYVYDATDDAWLKAMKLDEGIIYPYSRIYDRDGKLIHEGTTTHEEVEAKVAELLKK